MQKFLIFLILVIFFCFAPEDFRAQSSPNILPPATNSQYDLSVRVLPGESRIEVTGTVSLPAAATDRDAVKFLLWSRMQNLSVQILEPKTAAPLLDLSSDNADGDRTWTVKPRKPFPAKLPVLLRFSYVSDGKLYPQFAVGADSSYAGGGGELWYPQTSFKERETGTLRFRVPPGETAISNGAVISTAAQKAKGEFIFRITKPVKFAFAAGKYQTFRRDGKLPITLFLLKPRETARTIIDSSAKALNFLIGLNGEFPYPEFSLVEVDFRGRLGGTGEFGFIFADKKEFDVYNLSYWAHEIGHQWWGNVVRSKSNEFGQMMFSEGIAQFGSLLAVEAVEGEKAAADFRRYGYRGFRKIHSANGYFELISAGTDFPLTLYKPKDQNETLLMHRLANSKGFILMDMLSRHIGREKFAAILKRFIKERAAELTSWREFQIFVEAHAGRGVHWFFEQWFERAGAPDYQLDWKQEGTRRIKGKISQSAPYFRAALEVEIVGAKNQKLLKTVEIRGEEIRFDWSVPFKVKRVILDPDYKVLRWLPEYRAAAVSLVRNQPAGERLPSSGRSPN